MSYSLATLDNISKRSADSGENGPMLGTSTRRSPEPVSLNPPAVHTQVTFGVMGVVGIIVSIVTFVMDIVADVMLSISLGNRYLASNNFEDRSWFVVTILIIIIPAIVINIFSLWWYNQNKQCLGDYGILYTMPISQIILRIIMHLLLLGQLIRYIDMYEYGKRMQKEVRIVNMGREGQVRRRTPRGESYAVLQMVISRDTAMLDMMHSFLQDSPQLVFQIFLLYRSPAIITGQQNEEALTILGTQLWKILIAVFSISWSMVSYQDELRRSVVSKTQLSCGGTVACLIWRACMILARVIVIASFAAIQTRRGKDDFWTYPVVTALIMSIHWLIMILWIHAQNTNFCGEIEISRERETISSTKKHPVLEFFYNIVMGWVHVFAYINLKDTPSRRRIIFYYGIIFLENTILMAIWFMEVGAVGPEYNNLLTELWFRVTMLSSVEILFITGICCLLGYYGFLHPDRESIWSPTSQPSWRA